MVLLACGIVGICIYKHKKANNEKKHIPQTYTGAGCAASRPRTDMVSSPPNDTIFDLICELSDVVQSDEWAGAIKGVLTATRSWHTYLTNISKYDNPIVRMLLEGVRVRARIQDFETRYESPYKNDNDIVPYRWDNYIDYTYPRYVFVVSGDPAGIPEKCASTNGIVLEYICLGYTVAGRNPHAQQQVALYNDVCDLTTRNTESMYVGPAITRRTNRNTIAAVSRDQLPILVYKRILDVPANRRTENTAVPAADTTELDSIHNGIAELYKRVPVWDQKIRYPDIPSAKRAYSRLYRCVCAQFHTYVHNAWHTVNGLFLSFQTVWVHNTLLRIHDTEVDADWKTMQCVKSELDTYIESYKKAYRSENHTNYSSKDHIRALYDQIDNIIVLRHDKAKATQNVIDKANLCDYAELKYDIWAHLKTTKKIQLYENTTIAAGAVPGHEFVPGTDGDIKTTDDVAAYIKYLTSVNCTDAASLKISKLLVCSCFGIPASTDVCADAGGDTILLSPPAPAPSCWARWCCHTRPAR